MTAASLAGESLTPVALTERFCAKSCVAHDFRRMLCRSNTGDTALCCLRPLRYKRQLPFDGEYDTSNVGRTPNAAEDAKYPGLDK